MATVVQDSFSAEDFTDIAGGYIGEFGAFWTKHDHYGTGSFRIRNSGVYPYDGSALVYASGIPGTDEYDVEADYHYISNTVALGICGRVQRDENTLYYVYHNNNEWVFVRCVNGVLFNIGAYPQVLSPNSTHKVKLEIRNSAKKVYVNGSEIMSSSDNTITGVGRAGLRSPMASGDNEGKQVRYFQVMDLVPDPVVSDEGTLSVSESFDITPNAVVFDSDTVAIEEDVLLDSSFSQTDTTPIDVDESISFVNGIVQFASVSLDVSDIMTTNVYAYIQHTESVACEEAFYVSTFYPPLVNDQYEDLIATRSQMIHDIAHDEIAQHVQIMYHHHGIFDTIESVPLGQFVLGESPIGGMPEDFEELQDVTNFVAVDDTFQPLLVGTVFTDWELGDITINISKDIYFYQPLLADFGIALEGVG